MQNPEKEITSVVRQLAAAESPDIQKAAFEKYMAPDVSFQHPVCAVASGANSREELLGIYQYMVFFPFTTCIRLSGRVKVVSHFVSTSRYSGWEYRQASIYYSFSRKMSLIIFDIVFDRVQNLLYLECVQWFKLFFLPISAAPAR